MSKFCLYPQTWGRVSLRDILFKSNGTEKLTILIVNHLIVWFDKNVKIVKEEQSMHMILFARDNDDEDWIV